MAYPIRIKDPDTTEVYGFDVCNLVPEGDSIASYSWTIPTGLTLDASLQNDTTLMCRISGGTLGECYKCVLGFSLLQGETKQRTLVIQIANT